jgi:hypothetical protein
MSEWIGDLSAFIHGREEYLYGTSSPDEIKVMTREGKIAIQKDPQWDELIKAMELFSG